MSKPFDERERKAWDSVSDMLRAFQEIDERGPLQWNHEELASAVHVIQHFITHHKDHRLWPEEYSDWWEPRGEPGNS